MTREKRDRERLLSRKQELERMNEIAADDSAPVALDQQSVGRLSRMDAMQQQAMSQEQQRRREQEILRIERALQRVDDGDYGDCTDCGDPIAEKRLDVDPAAHLCVACARRNEA